MPKLIRSATGIFTAGLLWQAFNPTTPLRLAVFGFVAVAVVFFGLTLAAWWEDA